MTPEERKAAERFPGDLMGPLMASFGLDPHGHEQAAEQAADDPIHPYEQEA